ncbi:hypothetical protein [Pelagibius sp. Alg239-R121]|uniref:hypothetical protein n=1 Tax=Pelagibius sp. Alg239-R121 TaxID=2993448 RepID=UPI0024A6948B|nr:hypothetical protein [Pelagibius sp. Alg239-R121]
MRKKFKRIAIRTVLGCTAMAALAVAAQAEPIRTFFGEDLHNSRTTRLSSTPNADAAAAEFLSNLSGTGTEEFESFSSGSVSSLALSFPGSMGSTITSTLSNPAGSNIVINNRTSGTNGYGRYPISGDQYLDVDGANFQIDFDNGIAAFGFYGIDIGDFGGELSLTLANGVTESLDIGNTVGSGGSTDGSVLFFGLITDSPFTQLTFANSTTSDIFAFDNMTIGDLSQIVPPTASVPEPASLASFGFGLLSLALLTLPATRKRLAFRT